MANLELRGLDELIAALGRVEDLPKLLEPATREVLTMLRERMQEYPPPPANSTYRRTGNLRESWREYPLSSGDVLGRVRSEGAIAPYNRYVQAAADQAWMHEGRWQTEQQVAQEKEEEAVRILSEYLASVLVSMT